MIVFVDIDTKYVMNGEKKIKYVYQIFYKNEWKIKIRKGSLVSVCNIVAVFVHVSLIECRMELYKKPQISWQKR